MKIGRNDPCPCGSGKKYKKCCLNKSEIQFLAEAAFDAQKNLKRDGQIKQCLHPNKDECTDKIVKAHAIQNNRILTKIAENGWVKTLNGTSNLIFQSSQEQGRKIATTFTGFCSYHDKKLFQAIEDQPFTATAKQIFLFTYRTMAWHYHKKEEQHKRTELFHKNMAAKGYSSSSEFIDALVLGINDNKVKKSLFDTALLKDDFSLINYCIWEIPYEISFAVSMQYEPTFDLAGNQINDYEHDEILKSIYLNVFPADGKSYCIWSWLANDDAIFKSYTNQFMELPLSDRKNFLNNKLPVWTDSLVISPVLWKKWGKPIQEALIAHANFDKLYFAMELEHGGRPYQYMDTPWDLFEPIQNI